MSIQGLPCQGKKSREWCSRPLGYPGPRLHNYLYLFCFSPSHCCNPNNFFFFHSSCLVAKHVSQGLIWELSLSTAGVETGLKYMTQLRERNGLNFEQEKLIVKLFFFSFLLPNFCSIGWFIGKIRSICACRNCLLKV